MTADRWRIPLPDRLGEIWQRWFPGLGPKLAALESWSISSEFDLSRVERPVFIGGMARSGSTMLLEWLSDLPGFTAHRYSDFPMLWTPYWWNRLLAQLPPPTMAPVERAHGDGIQVTRASPEAFEEPIWSHYFPYDARDSDVLNASTEAPAFERCFREHLAKLVHARGARRYVSKGNYNTLRIGYLARLFDEARFIVPIRAPLPQVASLLRQDARHREAPMRTLRHIAARGHHEFGPLQRLQRVDAPSTLAARDARAEGRHAEAWLRQWLAVYGHVQVLCTQDASLQARIRVVAHDEVSSAPGRVLPALLTFLGLGDDDDAQRHTQAKWVSRFALREQDAGALRETLPEALLAEAEALYRQLCRPAG